MISRREFIRQAGGTVAALSVSPGMTAFADDIPQLLSRSIPGTDEMLPVIGLGNSQAFGSGNLELSRQLLDIFMARGGGYIDTSGTGRFTVGEIMRERAAHDQLFLGTYLDAKQDGEARQEIKRVSEGQGGGTLDLVLTRSVTDFTLREAEFHGLKEDGLTRYLGVGRPHKRYYQPIMKLMSSGAIDIVQINYSMLEPEAADRLLPLAQDKGIAVVINRPFINGQFFSLVKGRTLPDWAADFDCHSWAQFSLKYIISHPAVNCVLTETSNPKHAIDNLGAGVGRLPDEKTRQRMRKVMLDLV